MWELLGALFSRPSYLIILGLIGLSTWLYAQSVYYKSETLEWRGKAVTAEQNSATVNSNNEKLKGAVSEVQGEFARLKSNYVVLEGKVEEEKKRVSYWKDQYQKKVCFNNGDEEPVRPEKGKVLNEIKSVEAVRTINRLLTTGGMP